MCLDYALASYTCKLIMHVVYVACLAEVNVVVKVVEGFEPFLW